MERTTNPANGVRFAGTPPRWDFYRMRQDLFHAQRVIWHLKGQIHGLLQQNKKSLDGKANSDTPDIRHETISYYESQIFSLKKSLRFRVNQVNFIQHRSQMEYDTLAARRAAENQKLSEQLRSREAEFLQAEKAWEAKYNALEEQFRKQLAEKDPSRETSETQLEENQETGAAQLEENQETGATQVDQSRETSATQLEENQETGATQLEENQETGATQVDQSRETSATQLEENQETGATQLEENQETGATQLEENRETGATQLEENRETGAAQLEENRETGATQLDQSQETGVIQVEEEEKKDVEELRLNMKEKKGGFWSRRTWMKTGHTKVEEEKNKKDKKEMKRKEKEQKKEMKRKEKEQKKKKK
ncbi:trichohyalin-like isoform X2 [Siniperca chuatsi]|uniref:trichohyalin-like isoform X2 n=1 Tax=Siniperca chuatsi TaxID=119488 RepID=UPI001CE06250|nr:trichohyalin-like isoform X2 [Siniperca chuatsi]